MIITATHILFAITLLPFLPLKSLREKGIFLTPTCSNSKNIWFCFYIWKVKPSSVNFELLVSVSIFLLFYVQLCSMTSCILFFFLFFHFSVAYPIRSKPTTHNTSNFPKFHIWVQGLHSFNFELTKCNDQNLRY